MTSVYSLDVSDFSSSDFHTLTRVNLHPSRERPLTATSLHLVQPHLRDRASAVCWFRCLSFLSFLLMTMYFYIGGSNHQPAPEGAARGPLGCRNLDAVAETARFVSEECLKDRLGCRSFDQVLPLPPLPQRMPKLPLPPQPKLHLPSGRCRAIVLGTVTPVAVLTICDKVASFRNKMERFRLFWVCSQPPAPQSQRRLPQPFSRRHLHSHH